jgi:hypothetical protein
MQSLANSRVSRTERKGMCLGVETRVKDAVLESNRMRDYESKNMWQMCKFNFYPFLFSSQINL